jgi:DNA-binding transcriptional regulator YdaS (Cro superfamily)
MLGVLEGRLARALSGARVSKSAAAACIGVSRIMVDLWLNEGAPISARHAPSVVVFLDALDRAMSDGVLPHPVRIRPLGATAAQNRLAKYLR